MVFDLAVAGLNFSAKIAICRLIVFAAAVIYMYAFLQQQLFASRVALPDYIPFLETF
jgi:hypothetical protein